MTNCRAPVAAGCDHSDIKVEVPLTDGQRAALLADLGGDAA